MLRRRLLVLTLVGSLLIAMPAASAATSPVVRVTSSLDTVQPLEPVAGTARADLRALRGEFEAFQLIIGGPGGAALKDVDVIAGPLTGAGGATIPARNITVYAERYTRIWTPSDQEGLDENPALPSYDRGWCQWFPDQEGGTCGIPTDLTEDGTPYNTEWKCGDVTAPVIDARHCLIPDALVPRVDPFTGQRRNAFPLDVPADENRVAWVDVLVPPGAGAGTYTGTIAVSASGHTTVNVPVSLDVLPVTLPASGTRPALELQGGVRATVSQFCRMFDCTADRNVVARSYSLFVRSALEHRLQLTTVAPFSPATGPARAAFDRWLAPYFTGNASAAADDVVRVPRLPAARQRLVLLDHWAPRAEWAQWVDALGDVGALSALSYYCDEFMTREATFRQYCADPYANNAQPAWPAGAGKPSAMLIGSQAQYATAHTWGYEITAAADRLVPNMAFHLHQRGKPNTRPSYDTGFLSTAGREVWGYDSNNSLGAGSEWSIANAYNGYPVLGGVDQPATSERSIGFTSWSYRLKGHFYYEALHRFADSWKDCSVTPNACLYDYFGGHGDGTLFYPGTTGRVGGTTDIPIESLRLKRYRDGSEDYTILRLLETGCNGLCADHSRAALAAIVGAPEAGAGGLMPQMWRTSVGAAAYDATRDQLLDRIPPALDESSADISVTGTAVKAPAGPHFSYRLTVANSGPDAATGIELTTNLPDGVRLMSTDGLSCRASDAGLVCDVANLAAGARRVVDLVLQPGHHGPFEAVVIAVADERDPSPGNQDVLVVARSNVVCDIVGTAAANTLVGTAAAEVLCGAGGNDQLMGKGGNDLLFGGTGSDTVRYGTSPHAMVVNLNFQRADAEGAWPRYAGESGDGRDHLASVEAAAGSRGPDFLLGRTGAADRLWGGKGRDLMYGYGGSDRLNGGPANDRLYGGTEHDTVNGGDGVDQCQDAADTKISCEQ